MLEYIKKLESQLTHIQREVHENDVYLKSAQELITQLKQEIKFIETEYVKVRATIMKFEEEQKKKTISQLVSKKLKKSEQQRLTKETLIQE